MILYNLLTMINIWLQNVWLVKQYSESDYEWHCDRIYCGWKFVFKMFENFFVGHQKSVHKYYYTLTAT